MLKCIKCTGIYVKKNGKIVLFLTHEIFCAPKPGGLQNALVTAMVLLIAHKNVGKLIGW